MQTFHSPLCAAHKFDCNAEIWTVVAGMWFEYAIFVISVLIKIIVIMIMIMTTSIIIIIAGTADRWFECSWFVPAAPPSCPAPVSDMEKEQIDV